MIRKKVDKIFVVIRIHSEYFVAFMDSLIVICHEK